MASNRPLPGDLTVTGMDQASQWAWMANVTDLLNELQAQTLIVQHMTQNRVIDVSPVLAIDTNFDVKNTEVTIFMAGGIAYSLTDNTNCDTGTTKTIATTKWGAFRVDATNATTLTAVWAAADYATEALALAAAKALTLVTAKCPIGYVTVQAAGSTWTAGTDALTTGSGGTAANATNYYSLSGPSIVALTSTTAISMLRS